MADLNRLEVLSPAGDMERLEAALEYGADAVYLGGKMFGMRSAPQNFDKDQLKKAVAMSHERGVRVYVTCNTLPRNDEIIHFEEFINDVTEAGADAVIANDIGVLSLIKKYRSRYGNPYFDSGGNSEFCNRKRVLQYGRKESGACKGAFA